MTRDRPFLEDGGHIDFLTTLCTQGARESYQYVSISVAILAKACGLVFSVVLFAQASCYSFYSKVAAAAAATLQFPLEVVD